MAGYIWTRCSRKARSGSMSQISCVGIVHSGLGLKPAKQVLHSQGIAFKAEAADGANTLRSNKGGLAIIFAGKYITDVYLNNRDTNGCNCICKRNAGVRISGGIEHDTVHGVAALMHEVDELAFH